MDGRTLPLDGVTILDLGQIYAGPYATFLMAMAGARVIKIEPPGGENLRRRSVVGGAALPFAMLNSNKAFVTLNLKSEAGRDLLRQLAVKADVLLENYAPGVMERLGVGWPALSALNPRLIYASCSGYGLTGPSRNVPAMDLTIQAMSGIMSVTGFPDRPPVRSGPAVCDFSGGTHLFGAVTAALYEREKTGRGRLVEVSMLEAVYASLSSSLGLWFGSHGEAAPRTGNRHGGLAEAPYNVYATEDGHIAILCVGERHWVSLAEAMEQPHLAADPRFTTLKARVENIDAVDALVSDFARPRTTEDLFELLMQHRVPCAPVRGLDDVVADPHLRARGFLSDVDHPSFGTLPLPGSPIRFEGSAPPPLKPSAELGQDTEAVLGDVLGLAPAEVAALRGAGAI